MADGGGESGDLGLLGFAFFLLPSSFIFCLILRAEPADVAALFFGGAFVVEGDEAGEDGLLGKVGGPAVGVGDGGVEVAVELLEDGDEALFVDRLFFGGERSGSGILPLVLGGRAAGSHFYGCSSGILPLGLGGKAAGSRFHTAELFEDVVHACHGQVGVSGLAGFAVRVEGLAEFADAGLLRVGAVGEREGFEAAGFHIHGIVAVAKIAPVGHGPCNMNAA